MVFRKFVVCTFFLGLLFAFVPRVHAEPTGKDLMSPDSEIAVMDTTQGRIVLGFYPNAAPNHVKNFKFLARKGFYDGTKFHRVIPHFMIQGGDPLSRGDDRSKMGTGDAGYTIKAEFNDISHKRGILSMARGTDENSASSQFFIMVFDNPQLDHHYTAFGYVVEGLAIADKIVNMPRDRNDNPMTPVVIKKVTIEKASTQSAATK